MLCKNKQKTHETMAPENIIGASESTVYDCALLVNKKLVNRFENETIIIGCPMLEDPKRVFEKLRMILKESEAEKIEVFTMEVPYCYAIHMMVDKAKEERDKDVEIEKYIVRVGGKIEKYSGKIDDDMVNAEIKAHKGMQNE